ncbi:MAG TPA: nucleotidyltransferase domain-containing protein [Deinococcales bacterium]|nr:nucleotidyltransferase domain-containing protein [Deinococcales bacterium]
MPDQNETVARVSAAFATLPEVVAVAVAGSASTGESDDLSDVDLYVFTREDLPLEKRAAVAYGFAPAAEVGHDRWGPNDEWEDPASGEGVDAVYWTTGWMEDAIDRLLLRHEPSVGYSTCFLHSIRLCRPLHDRPGGWRASRSGRTARTRTGCARRSSGTTTRCCATPAPVTGRSWERRWRAWMR